MPQNPYESPALASAAPHAPAGLTGRILAPLLMPPLLVPIALGVGLGLSEGMSYSGLGMMVLSVAPLTLLLAFFVSPVLMLVLLPFRRLSWLWRGLLASAFLLALLALLLVATPMYSGDGPVEVQFPQRVD
jgi:hypothetical protein